MFIKLELLIRVAASSRALYSSTTRALNRIFPKRWLRTIKLATITDGRTSGSITRSPWKPQVTAGNRRQGFIYRKQICDYRKQGLPTASNCRQWV